MKSQKIFAVFCSFLALANAHLSCCHTKEVGGITYHHIDDHNMVLPPNCTNHCVYKEDGNDDQLFCFGNGDKETKCVDGGECDLDLAEPPITTPSYNKDLIINITAAEKERVYGAWSDERLSAFEFTVILDDKSVPGFIQLAFSPCYLCAPYYQFLFFLASSANPISDRPTSQAFLTFNNEFNPIAGTFDYTIDAGEPAKFRVQTFPKRYGFIKLKAEYIPNKTPWNPVTVLDYTTIATDNLFPSPITYAVFGDNLTDYFSGSIPGDTKAATYSFRDVDRLPKYFPIADCREGYNIGFKALEEGVIPQVSIANLDIAEPLGVWNVDPSQLWCLNTPSSPCNCSTTQLNDSRGHVQDVGEAGTIVNKKTCKYLKADKESGASLELTTDSSEATKFQFVVAPNTEISQIRFDDNKYVVSWKNEDEFDAAAGTPVVKLGYQTNPLTSCFKKYNFLSNVKRECENTENIGKADWKPIIDCRENLNLAVTPPDSNSSDWRTAPFDPRNDNQLWRQDSEGRIINKADGKVFTWTSGGFRFEEPADSDFQWSFNTCIRSSQETTGPISQKFQAKSEPLQRCMNTADRFSTSGSVVSLYPCQTINPINGCFKFKKS